MMNNGEYKSQENNGEEETNLFLLLASLSKESMALSASKGMSEKSQEFRKRLNNT